MTVGEFTVSNIHMDEDKREEEKKKSNIDIEKLKADIQAQLEIGKQVGITQLLLHKGLFALASFHVLFLCTGQAPRGLGSFAEPGEGSSSRRGCHCHQSSLHRGVGGDLPSQAVEIARGADPPAHQEEIAAEAGRGLKKGLV
jgi:hypothetical protein